eukprot:scaffold641_cov490-Prasinococcus_capsulatus_cf.AAC.16
MPEWSWARRQRGARRAALARPVRPARPVGRTWLSPRSRARHGTASARDGEAGGTWRLELDSAGRRSAAAAWRGLFWGAGVSWHGRAIRRVARTILPGTLLAGGIGTGRPLRTIHRSSATHAVYPLDGPSPLWGPHAASLRVKWRRPELPAWPAARPGSVGPQRGPARWASGCRPALHAGTSVDNSFAMRPRPHPILRDRLAPSGTAATAGGVHTLATLPTRGAHRGQPRFIPASCALS